MLSLVLVVIIVGNVILWSYQMNQVDMDRMQEIFSLTNVTRVTRSSWSTAQSEFSISTGTRLSGTYAATTVSDGFFESFREELQSSDVYNPSSYALGGSTSYISGNITNLNSNDNAYMNFRGHISGSSNTSQTDAFVAYRDSTTTLNTPKGRTWFGSNATLSAQSDMPTSDSPVRWVRVAYSPVESRSLEKIVVTLSIDGNLDAYVFDGTTWTVTNNIASPGTTVDDYKCFDVAYEKASGRALLVYSRGTTSNEVGYRIWTYGFGWGSEQLLDLPYTSGRVRWVSLASSPGTRAGTDDDDEIAMIYLDGNADVHGYTWNGSTWSLMGATAVWETNAAIAAEECFAVAYEQTTGEAMFIWGTQNNVDNYYRIWNGTSLTSPTLLQISTQGGVTNWVTLKADPASDDLFLTVIDGAQDLNTAYWSGSAWTVHTEHDGTVDTDAERCADFAWEPTGGKGLLVWGTTAGQIAYETFTAPNTWGMQQNLAMGANVHRWVQLRTNTRSITGDTLILGAVLEGTVFDMGAIRWDGTTFTVVGSNNISTDTTTTAYECYELEFMNFGTPEFTSEVELSGSANTYNWTMLDWTTDLAFTTPDVTTTFQLYDYNASQYSASGDGYMTDTIGQTDVTKSQTIASDLTRFRDVNGNWKIKIKGTKIAYTPFDMQIDWMEFRTTSSGVYRLVIENDFALDLSTYPREFLAGIELLIKYNVTEDSERWYLNAYNWTAGEFSNAGFNSTEGNQPVSGEWSEYAVSVPDNWADYVNNEGVMRVRFYDEGLSGNQTEVGLDFMGVRAITNGASFSIKNSSPLSLHIVAIWITNSSTHERYNANLFLNAGETATYIRADVGLPQGAHLAKVVTERGNTAVLSED
jgi:hypothetical protein